MSAAHGSEPNVYKFTVRLYWDECPGLGIDRDMHKDLTVHAATFELAEDRASELADKHEADGWEIVGDGAPA